MLHALIRLKEEERALSHQLLDLQTLNITDEHEVRRFDRSAMIQQTLREIEDVQAAIALIESSVAPAARKAAW